MDRPTHRLAAACALGLLLTAPGCRSTRPEVPPARPYSNDGRQRQPIGFSSEGHPVNGAATAVFQPGVTPNMRPGPSHDGRSAGSTPYGAIPGPAYGAPGTSGLGEPPTPAPSAEPPAMRAPATLPEPAALPAPTAPDLEVQPPSLGQALAPEPTAPGAMGRPGDLPSPN